MMVRVVVTGVAVGVVATVGSTLALSVFVPTHVRASSRPLEVVQLTNPAPTIVRVGSTFKSFGAIRRHWIGALGIDRGQVHAWDSSLVSVWRVGGDADMDRYLANDRRGIWDDARGWPALCAWSSFFPEGPTGAVDRAAVGGFELEPFGGRRSAITLRVIPYRILWKGILVNVVFWGTVLMVPWLVMGQVVRHRRLRAGLCASCRYVLDDPRVACPECGLVNMRTGA